MNTGTIKKLMFICLVICTSLAISANSFAMNARDEENIAIVKSYYSRMSNGEIDRIMDMVSDNFMCKLYYPSETPSSGEYHGKQQLAGLLTNLHKSLESFSFEFDNFLAHSNQVVVLISEIQKVKATRKEASIRHVHVFTILRGLITRFDGFIDGDAYKYMWTADFDSVDENH